MVYKSTRCCFLYIYSNQYKHCSLCCLPMYVLKNHHTGRTTVNKSHKGEDIKPKYQSHKHAILNQNNGPNKQREMFNNVMKWLTCFRQTTVPETSTIGFFLQCSTKSVRELNFSPPPTSYLPSWNNNFKNKFANCIQSDLKSFNLVLKCLEIQTKQIHKYNFMQFLQTSVNSINDDTNALLWTVLMQDQTLKKEVLITK